MHFRITNYFLILTLAIATASSAIQSSPFASSGHSHNDYQNARPLWGAIEKNFISIEVDIHLVGQDLLVGHDEEELDANLTLQSLYLNPLRTYINEHNGWVYPERELILLIDIKTDADSTYRLLRKELYRYSDILTSYISDRVERRAVSAVISGNRPRELMLSKDVRYATYDGRLPDLNREMPSNFMTLISDNWEDHFAWRGKGPMSSTDRHKLRQVIDRAHSKGYKIRFWNLPTNDLSVRRTVWAELISLGVDLINVDDLKAYQDFLIDKYTK